MVSAAIAQYDLRVTPDGTLHASQKRRSVSDRECFRTQPRRAEPRASTELPVVRNPHGRFNLIRIGELSDCMLLLGHALFEKQSQWH